MLQIRNYVRVQSLEEAYTLNQKRSNRILGGMLWMRQGNGSIDTAIDLSSLGLDTIEEDEKEFRIGCMCTLRTLEMHEGLNAYTGHAVRRAVQDIVGVQFRNLATVGGSLWGRFGFSDVLTVFLAADSHVELYKGGSVPLAEFAASGRDKDILVALHVRKVPLRMAYEALRIQHTDFPVLNCAVSCVDGQYRAVIGARPGRAICLYDDDGILDVGLTDEAIAAFAAGLADRTPTGSNIRGSAAYRRHLVPVLTERALRQLKGDNA